MKKLFLLPSILIFGISNAHAFKYVIYTDQPDGKKAKEVAETMKNTYPFNANGVEFEIVNLPSSQLDCASRTKDSTGKIMERTVSCDNTVGLNSMTARRGGDQAMIVKDLNYHGGSAAEGGIPVMTTGSNPRVMLHEYMHTLGLCDEYEFKAEEANLYCSGRNKRDNSVVIEDELPTYINDAHARREHRFDIPWFGKILETTLITQGKSLGTGTVGNELEVPNNSNIPSVLNEPIGLYQGKSCKNATPSKKTWLPGGKKTVMDNYEAGLGAAMEAKVDEILKSKGTKSKLEYSQPSDTVTNENSQPDVTVNDSPRNFFKDFFEALGNLFRDIFNSITR
jgi:hypothetical protein